MLQIIDRYILKMFLAYLVAGLAVFVTLFVAVDFTSTFVRYDVSPGTLLAYYAYFSPAIIYQMIPVACLMATVFTLSGINRTQELTALYSVGMSLARISAPILVSVGIVSALSFWMGDRLVPLATQKKNFVYYVDIRNQPGLYSTVKKNKIWFRSENVLFNIQTLNAPERRAQGLSLYYFNQAWDLVQLVRAENVSMDGNSWDLRNGSVTIFTEDSSFPLTREFKTKRIAMGGSGISDIESSSKTSDIMNISELSRFITRNKAAGLDTVNYEVDYHSKFSFAFAAFVMTLLGIPFSVRGSRRSGGTMVNAGMCILLTFVYWVFYSSGLALGKYGSLSPFISAWLPNIVMTLLAVNFLVRLRR